MASGRSTALAIKNRDFTTGGAMNMTNESRECHNPTRQRETCSSTLNELRVTGRADRPWPSVGVDDIATEPVRLVQISLWQEIPRTRMNAAPRSWILSRMGIPARRSAVGQECPTYILEADNVLHLWFPAGLVFASPQFHGGIVVQHVSIRGVALQGIASAMGNIPQMTQQCRFVPFFNVRIQ